MMRTKSQGFCPAEICLKTAVTLLVHLLVIQAPQKYTYFPPLSPTFFSTRLMSALPPGK
jgi:hypothetical protein